MRFIFLLPLLFSFAAYSAAVADYIRPAEVIKVSAVQSINSTEIKISTMIKGFAANDPYGIKTVSVPKNNFMSFVKGNLKDLVKVNPWWIAYGAAIAAAGWAINELTGQVTYNQMTFTGQCGTNSGIFYNYTFEQCLSKVLDGDTLKQQVLVSGPSQLTIGQTSSYQIYACAASNPSVCSGARTLAFTPQSSSSSGPVEVTDDGLYDSISAQMMNDTTKAAQAFMVPDAYPYPYPFVPAQTEYIPGVSQSDQELLDWYLKGLAQSSNPSQPYYIAPDKMPAIQALASQLAQGITPEGQTAAANDALNQPLTQAGLQETLAKEQAKEAASAEALKTAVEPALATVDAALDQLKADGDSILTGITDSVGANPPSSLSIPMDWLWPSGNCAPVPVTFEIRGHSANFSDGGKFCDMYDSVFHPLLYWFLNLVCLFVCWGIWNNTMIQVVKK